MNAVSPAYAFDLTSQRFDAYVASAFASTNAARHMRDQLIAELGDGRLDRFLLRRVPGLERLPVEVERRAALNMIDFHFEAIVTPTMTVNQAGAYFQAIERSMAFVDAGGLDGEGPLWVDTVHHTCVFSVLHQLAAHLRQRRGVRRVILLHQGVRPEPRLAVVTNLLAALHGVELDCIPLGGQWLKRLAASVTPDAAIFYLTDMPPQAFGATAAKRRGASETHLYAEPDIRVPMRTVSGSKALARRLRARHVLLDYPSREHARIRPYDASDAAAYCPLDEWVFWPLLAPAEEQEPAREPRPAPAPRVRRKKPVRADASGAAA